MTKILMRAGMSPIKKYSVMEMIHNNMIGNNMGNMLFPYAIMNNIMTDDVKIDTRLFFDSISKRKIDKINRKYDYFLIPLANAFRISFIDELNRITSFVEQLKIPAIVIGVGVQRKASDAVKILELCDAVRRFMDAVLKRSAMVGVRGENTAKYLELLGYEREKDFTVVGCPSMYLYGDKLPDNHYHCLDDNSKISINSKAELKEPLHEFLYHTKQKFKDVCYVPQVIDEIRHMYYGKDTVKNLTDNISKFFPMKFGYEKEGEWEAKSFLHPQAWMDYLKERDFSVGSRIHGNIAAILAGTPCFIIVSDERIKELVEYHKIPHCFLKDLKPDSDLLEMIQSQDFNSIYDGYKERFEHYLDFLHKNGLKTVFDEKEEKSLHAKQKLRKYSGKCVLIPKDNVGAMVRVKRQIEGAEWTIKWCRRWNRLKKILDVS